MTLPIHTARLIVRDYTLDDLDDVYEVFADPRVSPGPPPEEAGSS